MSIAEEPTGLVATEEGLVEELIDFLLDTDLLQLDNIDLMLGDPIVDRVCFDGPYELNRDELSRLLSCQCMCNAVLARVCENEPDWLSAACWHRE